MSLNSPVLTYHEYCIINAMIKRKRPLTARQLSGVLLGSKESAVQTTIDTLIKDDMIRDHNKDGKYTITLSGWNAWEHANQFGTKKQEE